MTGMRVGLRHPVPPLCPCGICLDTLSPNGHPTEAFDLRRPAEYQGPEIVGLTPRRAER